WGRALTALGYLTAVKGDADRAIELLDENLAFWRRVGDPRALAVALFFRATAVGWTRADPSALPLMQQSLDFALQRGPRWTVYFSLLGLGEGARIMGDIERAQTLLDQSLDMSREAGDRWGMCFALNS